MNDTPEPDLDEAVVEPAASAAPAPAEKPAEAAPQHAAEQSPEQEAAEPSADAAEQGVAPETQPEDRLPEPVAEQLPEQTAHGGDPGDIAECAGRAAVHTGARQIAGDFLRQIHDRHALQPDMARSGQSGEEQALAAEQQIAKTAHQLNVELHRR